MNPNLASVLYWKCIDQNCPVLKEDVVVASSLLGGPGDGGAEHLFTYRVQFKSERDAVNETGVLTQNFVHNAISSGLFQTSVIEASAQFLRSPFRSGFKSEQLFIANKSEGLIFGPIVMTSALHVQQIISGINCMDWGFAETFNYEWGDIIKATIPTAEVGSIIQKAYGESCGDGGQNDAFMYIIHIESPAGASDAVIEANAGRVIDAIDAQIRSGLLAPRLVEALMDHFGDENWFTKGRGGVVAKDIPLYSLQYTTIASHAAASPSLPLRPLRSGGSGGKGGDGRGGGGGFDLAREADSGVVGVVQGGLAVGDEESARKRGRTALDRGGGGPKSSRPRFRSRSRRSRRSQPKRRLRK